MNFLASPCPLQPRAALALAVAQGEGSEHHCVLSPSPNKPFPLPFSFGEGGRRPDEAKRGWGEAFIISILKQIIKMYVILV